jgi:hypothetical protein
MIRVCSRLFVVVACVLGFSTAAYAVPILDLFNTGVDASGNLLIGSDGTLDPHYDVISGPGIGAPVDAVTFKHPAYFADGPNSRWISSDAGGSQGNGTFVFQTTFTLPALFDPAATFIQVSCATDNFMAGATLNGSGVGGACTGFGGFASPFNITSGFQAGTNTLQFSVGDSGPPMAFRAEYVSNTRVLPGPGPGVPEPASVLLLGFGLAAMRLHKGRRS